jgi:regulator of protease activity HflC (stomatin/prohibitin superfamily)
MNSYGYDIIKALVTDIDPDEQVKHAMNRINAAEREKQLQNMNLKHRESELLPLQKQKQNLKTTGTGDCRSKKRNCKRS